MPKLTDIEREIIRRGPAGSAACLAKRFGVSQRCVRKLRDGSRGLPGLNGLGMRPWQIRSRELVEKWRTLQLARIEAAYQRALEAMEKNEAVSITLPPLTREDALALVPGEPGSLVVFEGALARKPSAAPKPQPAPVPKPPLSEPGVFYDRPGARRGTR